MRRVGGPRHRRRRWDHPPHGQVGRGARCAHPRRQHGQAWIHDGDARRRCVGARPRLSETRRVGGGARHPGRRGDARGRVVDGLGAERGRGEPRRRGAAHYGARLRGWRVPRRLPRRRRDPGHGHGQHRLRHGGGRPRPGTAEPAARAGAGVPPSLHVDTSGLGRGEPRRARNRRRGRRRRQPRRPQRPRPRARRRRAGEQERQDGQVPPRPQASLLFRDAGAAPWAGPAARRAAAGPP